MKTTTENITLSPGLNDTELSAESLSTLIDTWSELQTSAVEAVQTPTPNLFSFAESCFFFAVILQHEPLHSGVGGQVDSKVEEIDNEEEFRRAVKRSAQAPSVQYPADASSSTVSFGDGANNGLRGEFMSPGVERAWGTEQSSGLNLGVLGVTGGASLAGISYGHNSLNRQEIPNPFDMRQTSTYSMSVPGVTAPPLVPDIDRPWRAGEHSTHHEHNTKPKKAIGMVYLTSSPNENVPAGEVNIGIILTPEARGKGLAREATCLVLSWVFDDIGFHRVQAGVLDVPGKDRVISLFTQLGFVHEGIRRRCVYCPNEGARGIWKDVTYLALLETEWFMRSYLKPAPKSLWDEMFARHAREREALLRWEEGQQKLKRTSSMETVRFLDTVSETASTSGEESGDDASRPTSGVYVPLLHKGKRRKLDESPFLDGQSQASSPPPSDSEQSDASWDMESNASDEAMQFPPSGTATRVADFFLSGLSDSELGSPSSAGWDMLETSSISSSSFESVQDSDDE